MEDRKKVLIIEDEIELCELLKNYFLRKQYDVHVSYTLNEGISALNSLYPDIVLLDNNLPDGTGWKKGPEIFSHHPDVHIIFISGYHPMLNAMPENAHYSVIEKPISINNLEQNLATISSGTQRI